MSLYRRLICISSVTIGVAIISSALILSPSVPGELHPILGSAYFALASAMACRVFRAVLLGIIKDPQLTTTKIESFYGAANSNNQLSRSNGGAATSRQDNAGRPSRLDIKVAVETETDTIAEIDGYPLWERKLTRQDPSDQV
jgi:hypothetical protein